MAVNVLRQAQGENISDTLSTSIGATDTSIPVNTISKWSASGGNVIIDRGTSSQEIIAVSGVSGSSLVVFAGGRGFDGTTGVGHNSGATIESVPLAKDWDDLVTSVENAFLATTGALDTTKVVDLTTAQTLTHKTITDASNTVNANTLLSYPANATPTANNIPVLDANANLFPSGWFNYSAVTPTTGTFDSPSFPIVFAGVDLTSILSVGMKVKITQSTVKYFIITAISFSTNTTVTLYGGTDYSLVASGTTAISAFAFSPHKAPLSFPLDPTKWTVTVTDATDQTVSTPSSGTWYNPNAADQITLPIGVWDITYAATVYAVNSGSPTYIKIFSTLSTANNSASDVDLVAMGQIQATGATGFTLVNTLTRRKTLVIASKTLYYLNIMMLANGSGFSIALANSTDSTLRINAICAYL